MPEEDHIGQEWAKNTLHRATRVGQNVYQRAQARKIVWPKAKDYEQGPLKDPVVYTTIDDAFSTVLQFMSQTTRQCKRYYGSNPPCVQTTLDECHCDRFHTPAYTAVQHKNPLQRTEDVHIVVQPGTYAVSAGNWGTPHHQQSHMVHVETGQSVNLDFVM